MSLYEIITTGGSGCLILIVLSMLIQVTPIKFDPVTWLGSQFNKSLSIELDTIRKRQDALDARLNEHIAISDERNASLHRTRILRFNNELLSGILHTKEMYNEVLLDIDEYEHYCRTHPDYENNRAVRAMAHIKRSYDERLEKHDFLQE